MSASERRLLTRLVVPLVAAGLAVVVLRVFVFGFARVASTSMAPTLFAGDNVLVDKLAYRHELPRVGDVVVFDLDHVLYIKRVVGLPGDTVKLSGGVLLIDGAPVVREPLAEVDLDSSGEPVRTSSFIHEVELFEERFAHRAWRVAHRRAAKEADQGPFVVPKGCLFVLGDNRDASYDSRLKSFGPVPVGRLVGRVSRVAFSFGPRGFRWSRVFAPVR